MEAPDRRTISLLTTVIIIIVVALLLIHWSSTLTCYETRTVQLTDGPYDIERDEDSIALSSGLLLYSRTGTKRVRDNASGLMEDVWDNGTYVMDLEDGSEKRIYNGTLEARMSENRVVWREGNDILLLNVFTDDLRVLPVSDARPTSRPDIHGSYIVWADSRNDPKLDDDDVTVDIYLFNTSTELEVRLTTEGSNKGPPAVWGDLVVWTDDRNGDLDIYGLNLTNGTEMRITTDRNIQYSPKVSSRAIAWMDTRTSTHDWHEDIFYLDLVTWEERQASDTGSVESFDMSGDRIVWEDTSRENRPYETGDIMVHRIDKNRTWTYFASDWGQWSPAVDGKMVVWADGSRKGGEVFTKERVERPIFGLDKMTVAVILAVVIAGPVIMAAYRRDLRKQEEGTLHERRGRKAKASKDRKRASRARRK